MWEKKTREGARAGVDCNGTWERSPVGADVAELLAPALQKHIPISLIK